MQGLFETYIASVDRPLGWDGRSTHIAGPTAITPGQFWRRENPDTVPGKDGVPVLVRGGMWPRQREWWDLKNFIKVFVGGYGSGKTFVGCKRVISLALQNAPAPVACVSPTFPLARHTVVATIRALLAGKQTLLGRKFWWKYNRSVHEFKIRYRGREGTILIYSGDDPDALRGPNLGAAYLDEPFLMAEAVFEQMNARVRHPDAPQKEIILTGTPEQLNWGYDLCTGKMKMKNAVDVGVIRSSTKENKALDPAYVQRLYSILGKKSAEAYIEGLFVNLVEGLVYYGFRNGIPESPNVRRFLKADGSPEIPDDAELGAGMDFNVDPMAMVVFWKRNNHLHFFKEYELGNADTEYACQQLRDDFGDKLQDIYPDATGRHRATSAPGGKSDFWYIEQAGFNNHAPNESPRRKDRYNSVNAKLDPKKGEPTITVCPEGCPKLIKYLATYSHRLMKKQKQMSHLLDAFSYPVVYLYPIEKETLTVERLLGH